MRAEYIEIIQKIGTGKQRICFAIIAGTKRDKQHILDLIDGYDYDFFREGDILIYYLYTDGNGYEEFIKLWERAKELFLKGGEENDNQEVQTY